MDEDDPYPTYTKTKKSPIFRRDRHLASALNRGEIDYMFSQWDNPRGLKREHILLKKETKDVTYLPSDNFIHWALLHISDDNTSIRSSLRLCHHMRVADQTTSLGVKKYAHTDMEAMPLGGTHLLRQTFSIKSEFNRIVSKITFSTEFTADYSFFGCKAKCYGNLHVIWLSTSFAFVVTHSHFLAVRDCANSWFSALAYSYHNRWKYPGHDLHNEVADVIYAALHDIGIYKDKTYEILKSWQPLVIGTILKYMEASPEFLVSLSDPN